MISHLYYLTNLVLTMKLKPNNFLLFIIFILASSPTTISIENGTSDMVVTGAWKMMLAENRPPTDDDYLYVIGPNANMNILYMNPPNPDCETSGIEISFMYWANWNKTKFSVVKEGTELFRLAVMPCKRSMPATKFILFDDFDPTTWNYGVYTAARNNEFNFKCDKRVEIEVCDNEDYLDKIEPTDSYLVAIKDIHMKYLCIMKNAQSLLSNETCTTDFPGRCVDATCTKDNCPSSFTIKGGFWSSDRLPGRNEKYGDFWYTDESHKTASIILSEQDEMMACVELAYWITGKSNIRVDIGTITYNLETTIETESNKYKWKTITLCPRWFTQGQGDQESKIMLTSNIFNQNDVVAVSLVNLGLRRQNQHQTINNFLHHFSRPEAKEEWTIVPSYLDTSPVASSNFFLELTFPAQTDGSSYIFSKWFKYSPGLRFRGVLNARQLFGKFLVDLNVHESNGNIVFSRNLLNINPSSSDEMRSSQHLNIKLESIGTKALKKSTLCYMLIKVTFDSTQKSKLILNEIDVGDGCREGEINCMGHGTCINLEPDQYSCSCNRGWTGYHCESINFCQTVDLATGLTGDKFCNEGEGTCNPATFNPNSYTCECEIMRYWNLTKSFPKDRSKSVQIKGSCEPVSKCVGMLGICPHGYACDEETWSLEMPCQACNQELGFTMDEGKCVKLDACHKKCGTAKCYPFGTKYYCYCGNNYVYDENKQSCVLPEMCSPWMAQNMRCAHYCKIPNGSPECACHDGYELSSDGSCKPIFNCTISCPEGSVCALDSNNLSTCVCLSGWDWDETTGKCVDICKLADNGNQKWLKYVHDTCGLANRCSQHNGRLVCICNQPTVKNSDGLCELEKVCFPGNRGFTECNTRNALCEPRTEGHTFTYRCLCPPGKAFEDGFCIDQCKKKKSECESMNAVCRVIDDETEGSHIATCVCRPGFVMKLGYCYLAQHSIKATFFSKISDSKLHRYDTSADTLVETFCSNVDSYFLRECHLYTRAVIQHWLKEEAQSFMDRIVARYVDSNLAPSVKKFASQMIESVTLISYEKIKRVNKRDTDPQTSSFPLSSASVKANYQPVGDFKITVSLQLKSKLTGHSPMLGMFCYDVFSPNDSRHDYCLIPSKTLVRKGTFEESDLHPCKENSIDYCPKKSSCVSDHDATKYKCECNPGFKSQTSMKLDMADPSLTKNYCIDIDECFAGEVLCQGHSTCVNTIGSYNCICDDRYINVSGKCTELCEFQNCQHGECVVVSNQSAFCRCDPWYTGDRCEKTNKVAVFWRTMTIVVSSTLTSILVIFIVTSIIVARRSVKHQKATITYQLSKSHAVENGYLKNRIELTDSMYMQHIRPTMRNLRHQPISTNFDLQT